MALRNRTCLVGLLLAALVAPQVAGQGPASRGDSAAKDKTLPPQPGTGAGPNGVDWSRYLDCEDAPVTAVAAPDVEPNTASDDPRTSWGYVIVARKGVAEGRWRVVSPEGATHKGSAQLDPHNFNRIRWASVEGAEFYDIYRTTPPEGKIGEVPGDTTTFNDTERKKAEGTAPPSAPISLKRCTMSGPNFRFVVGGQTGAVSASPAKANLVIDLMADGPIAPIGRRNLEAWLDVRFSGAPAASSGIRVSEVVQGFKGPSTVLQGMTIDDLVQGFSLRAGLALPLGKSRETETTGDFKTETMFLFGIGYSTPVNAQVAPQQIFQYDESSEPLTAAYPRKLNPTTGRPYGNIAFVPADRSRFYGEWFVGGRFKLHHFHDSGRHLDSRGLPRRVDIAFPAVIDLTIGKSQAITGGALRGAVGQLDAFVPLPLEGIGSSIYLFGTMSAHLAKAGRAQAALTLPSADASVMLHDGTVQIQPIIPPDRDRWSVGIGLDLVTLFFPDRSDASKSTTAAQSRQSK